MHPAASSPAAPALALIGAPFDGGASVEGASLGPAALRLARIGPHLAALGFRVADRGDVSPATEEALTAGGHGRNARPAAATIRRSTTPCWRR